ncbi:hypothetical protein NX059_009897 [Plenodomus lindquistii]|nr:hypothetical protein NX059_009897 [Plenodomus lindquistii]
MRPITLLPVFLFFSSATAKKSEGKHGVLNIAIDMCKKAGTIPPKPGVPSIVEGCQHHMKSRAPSWNCQVCMNACLRYYIGDNESICERCVKKGCGDNVSK